MKAKPPGQIREAALMVAIAVASAVMTVWGASSLAKPSDFDARLAAVDHASQSAARMLRPSDRRPIPPAGAICTTAVVGAPKLRAELERQIVAAGLQASGVAVAASEPAAASSPLAPLKVTLEAHGSYDGAMALIGRLAEARPLVFVDTADLVSKTSEVSLSITGRAYCSAPS